MASAFAQGADAGDTDAGLPGTVGPLLAGTLVYPPAGATDVVLNTGLILRVEEAVLDPLSAGLLASGRSALGEGLLLRDDSGQLIATGEMVISPTVRPSIAPLLASADVEISTAPLVLSPETHYQVLSRVAVCPGEEGAARSVCLQNEYVEIADFTTGTESDRAGPTIVSIEQGPSLDGCWLALSVVASDDRAPPSALRFGVTDTAYLGPDVVLLPPASPSERRSMLPVVPIDPSNNRGPAFEIDVQGCTPVLVYGGSDYGAPVGYPVQPRPVIESQSSGCAVAPGPGSNAVGAGITLSSVLALLVAACRRARVRA